LIIISFSNFAAESSKSGKVIKTKICGTIVDKATGEALSGVVVKLIGTDVKIYTDFEGKFEIKNVEIGAHALEVAYISYQDVVENLFVDNTGETKITLKLKSVLK
jgi:hypothetical protein